jgi:hypothetical protein
MLKESLAIILAKIKIYKKKIYQLGKIIILIIHQ